MNCAIPVLFGILVQSTDDDVKQFLAILVYQLHNVVIVPEKKEYALQPGSVDM